MSMHKKNKNSKRKVKSNFVTSCLVFKDLIPTQGCIRAYMLFLDWAKLNDPSSR